MQINHVWLSLTENCHLESKFYTYKKNQSEPPWAFLMTTICEASWACTFRDQLQLFHRQGRPSTHCEDTLPSSALATVKLDHIKRATSMDTGKPWRLCRRWLDHLGLLLGFETGQGDLVAMATLVVLLIKLGLERTPKLRVQWEVPVNIVLSWAI